METYVLYGKDCEKYLQNMDAVGAPIRDTDMVVVELDDEARSATCTFVPGGENVGNFIPEEDNYEGAADALGEILKLCECGPQLLCMRLRVLLPVIDDSRCMTEGN